MNEPLRRLLIPFLIGLFFIPDAALTQQLDQPPVEALPDDKPKVAIIQYESGRVLVVQQVNGELLVIEPRNTKVSVLSRYLDQDARPPGRLPARGPAAAPPEPLRQQEQAAGPKSLGSVDALPLFYSPAWYPHPTGVGGDAHLRATHLERSIERRRQDAAELRQQVKARRRQQGAAGITSRAGRVYPSTAADREHGQASGPAAPGAGAWSYGNFYNLGYELEHYRQQELAARKELALLSYDALLGEGLAYFRARRYAQAARSFIAAADKDHGDASSRIHAAQCLMASGLYAQALAHARRAFELAPQLIYRPLNHRHNYVFPQDFDEHLAELERYVQAHPRDDAALLLLAYEQFFSDRPAKAAKAMRRVKTLARSDGFAKKLWKAAQPMLGDR